jgi:hypothetical protein
LNNGQSSPETASHAEFYKAKLIGGDASVGAGGDALVVNGFGTEAVIYGGEFVGGTGVASMGYSVKVMNSASVHSWRNLCWGYDGRRRGCYFTTWMLFYVKQ